ncbi:response regulator [Candidatus Cyanaurora vandensis]|uniref:hybrid sensor histidine kinase/response regulator n=1 Tax=Candidatus Cyanaurora vandensis TaxID=2714958 RepID=UPI00257CDE04|nr:response regulator [Candidatus Cyanaurora vandensis]
MEKPFKLLVVDDDAVDRLMVRRALKAAGVQMELEEAEDLATARRWLGETDFDCVFLDYLLPDGDGLLLLREVQAAGIKTPLVVLTGQGDEQLAVELMKAGAADYLTKQRVSPENLSQILRRVTRLYQAEKTAQLANQQLVQSEEKFRLLVESVQDYAIFSLDVAGQVVSWNRGAERILGYTEAEALGMPATQFFSPEDRHLAQRELETALSNGQTHSEYWQVCKDGSRFLANSVVTPLRVGTVRGFAKVMRDITGARLLEQERARILVLEKQARAIAERAQREAEATNRIKDEFLAVLSHELRTPLNSIIGFSNLLLRGKQNEATTQRALQTIERNGKLQAQLIEDLLDVSRIISGKLNLERYPLVPTRVLELAIESIRPQAQAKQIEITTHFTANPPQISADAVRFQQILWNLLSNAIKFTPTGGQVTVSLTVPQAGQVAITVQDTGQGIMPEVLPHIFERFRQADSTTTRRYGGLGLGLAIVSHLVELHQGEIKAESPGEDQGATFTITLPTLAEPAQRNQDQKMSCNGFDLEGLRILVVEDEADTRDLLSLMLEQCGATVTPASSVLEALATLMSSPQDVLVSDIGMPVEDGYALIRQVRERSPEQGGQVPAVALTAYARTEDRLRALAAGFQSHISKPVESEELVTVIAQLVGRTE